MKTILIYTILFTTILYAKEPLSLVKIFQDTFTKDVAVGQKDIVLSQKQKNTLQKLAKAKIDSNKIRFYVVKKTNKTVGYGVLLSQRIRTKKAVMLYLIDKDVKIKNIEILAFHEPSEYKPYSSWKNIFTGKTATDDLRAGHGVPTISGATLSARAISDAARIALAVVAEEK